MIAFAGFLQSAGGAIDVRGAVESGQLLASTPRLQVVLSGSNGSRRSALVSRSGRFKFANILIGSYEIAVLLPSGQTLLSEFLSVRPGLGVIPLRLPEQESPLRPGRNIVSAAMLDKKRHAEVLKEFEAGLKAMSRNDLAGQLKHFTAVTRLDRSNAAAFNNLAVAYQQEDRDDEALVNIETALRLDPDSPVFLANLAGSLIALGRPAEAEGPATRALTMAEAKGAGCYYLALSLFEQGKDVGEHSRCLTEISARNPAAHFLLAKIAEQLGDSDVERLELSAYIASGHPKQEYKARQMLEKLRSGSESNRPQ